MTKADAGDLLERGFGLRASQIERAPGGHTNDTWLVTIDGAARVLRASWPGKPIERAEREEAVLARLHDARVPAPRVIDRAVVDDRTLHLFERIEGRVLPMWLELDDVEVAADAIHALHAVHAALGPADARPTEWLRDRLARVRALPTHDLPEPVREHLVPALAELEALFDDADDRHGVRPSQWLHGDFHLGNVLRTPRGLVVIDFDDVGCGARSLEHALALCAIMRIDDDESLRFHREQFEPDVFVASQVLVHLEACQRGRWTLDRAIGFWACWRELMQAL